MQDQQCSGAVPGWYPDPSGRFEYRYWDGTAWTVHVVSAGCIGVDSGAVAHSAEEAVVTPAASAPTASRQVRSSAAVRTTQSALGKQLDERFVRRVFWCLYAVPISLVVTVATLSGLFPPTPLAVVDALLTLFAFAVMFLHIFDLRPRPQRLFRAASLIFIPWQFVYGFYLEPSSRGAAFDPSMLISLVFVMPTFVALIRYSVRRWPSGGFTSAARAPGIFAAVDQAPALANTGRRVRPGLVAVGIGVGFFGLLVLMLVGISFVRNGGATALAGRMSNRAVYEVKAKPPLDPGAVAAASPKLSSVGAARLRSALSRGDYTGLNREFAHLQDTIDADPKAESLMSDAAALFTARDNKASLDAWVSATPGDFAPHVVLADYYVAEGWRARGHDWAQNTSKEQFKAMGDAFSQALAQCDAAELARPRLPQVAVWRIAIANASGMDREERDVERALGDFPHSLAVHAIAMHAALPRWGGSYEDMERVADRGVSANPGDTRFLGLYGEIYVDQADLFNRNAAPDKATAMYTRALSYRQDPDWFAQRGLLYHDAYDLTKARADAEAGLRLNPLHVECLLLKADTIYHQGDAQSATALLDEAARLDPGSPTVAQIRAHLSGAP